MSRDKTHFFTSDFFVQPNGTVWFNSACKLIAASKPTEQEPNPRKTTCLRCTKALKKK